MGAGRSLTAAVAAHPARTFWCGLLAYGAAWWLAQVLTQGNFALDAVEMLVWGREWQLAHWKHPPLPAWVLDALYRLGGGSEAVVFLASPLFAMLTAWAVWRLAGRMLAPGLALLSVLPLLGIVYYGFTLPEFNHNVAQYPFFALVPLLMHRALGAGCPRPATWLNWQMLGIVAGLALYAKYSTVPLLMAAGLVLLAHPRGRQALATPGPWLALGAFLVMVLPHLVALWHIDFLPLATPALRAPQAVHWWQHFTFPAWFLTGQLVNCLGGLLILAALLIPGPRGIEADGPGDARVPSAFDRFFVLWMLVVPLVIALAYSVLAGQDLEHMWGSPFFALLGLAGILMLPRPPSARGVRAACALALTLALANLAGYSAKNLFEPHFSGRGMRAQFPGAALARAIEARWAELSGGRPLPVLVGGFWIAGNVATYSQDRPPVFIEADTAKSPWIDAHSLGRDGAIFVWAGDGGPPDWARAWADGLCRQPVLALAWQSHIALEPARISWATYGGGVCAAPAPSN